MWIGTVLSLQLAVPNQRMKVMKGVPETFCNCCEGDVRSTVPFSKLLHRTDFHFKVEILVHPIGY